MAEASCIGQVLKVLLLAGCPQPALVSYVFPGPTVPIGFG
jgi:hypothetical protein